MKLPSTGAILPTVLLVTLAGCAPTPFGGQPEAPGGEVRRIDQSRTVVMVGRVEPVTLSSKVLQSTGGAAIGGTARLFNAFLTILDDRGVARPYLTEQLPELNTDAWRVFPDGRMETTYRLRSGLTWHDGTPLTAEDFVFTWRVLATPEFGEASGAPQALMEELVAVDARTLVIRWRQPFRDAAILASNFLPLPRHVLAQPLQTQPDAFVSHPFWSTEYIGSGPFRLDRWQPGAFIEASAFDGHVWGRPRIGRLRIIFIGDANTALTNLLSGEAHVTLDDAIRFQQGAILKREWAPRGGGHILAIPDQWRRTEIQHRADYANPRAVLDVRVRKALAHTVDRQGLNEALFEGEGIMADSVITPTVDYSPLVDQATAKYPYDARRAEQLMTEAGYTRAADGSYASPTEGRLGWELKVNAGAQAETELAIMAAGWRQAGFDFREAILPAAQSRDGQIRATFPTLFTGGGTVGDDALDNFTTSRIPAADNRWTGSNRGGWSRPEFDRIAEAFNTTLDRRQRGQLVAQLVKIFSEDVGAISLYFNPGIVAHVASLRGPQLVSPDTPRTWNVHEWEWK